MSWRFLLPLVIFLALTLGYVDRTIFHKQGLKSIQKMIVTSQHRSITTEKEQQSQEREKGYFWAQEQDMLDESHCQGTVAFVQGCRSYILDTISDARQDMDSLEQ